MASIDSSKLYIISTTVSGQRMVLASSEGNNSIVIEPKTPGNEKHQHWKVSRSEFFDLFRLSTAHQLERGRSLDVFDDNGTESRNPWFATTGYYAGQFWVVDSSENGTYMLSNNFTGPYKHLGCFPGSLVPQMGSDGSPCQQWAITDIDTESSVTPTRPPDEPISAPSTATTTDLTENPYGLAPETNGKLSATGIVGVAVGGAVVLVLALGVGFVVLISFRRTKQRKRPQRPAAPFRDRSYTAKWHGEELPMPQYVPTLGADNSSETPVANLSHHHDQGHTPTE